MPTCIRQGNPKHQRDLGEAQDLSKCEDQVSRQAFESNPSGIRTVWSQVDSTVRNWAAGIVADSVWHAYRHHDQNRVDIAMCSYSHLTGRL